MVRRYGKVDTDGTGKFRLSQDKGFDRALALANPFWTLISNTENRRPFNFSRALEKLAAKATERAVSLSPGDDVDLVLLFEVKRLIGVSR
ncbi:hypothetical protein [Mesorhizobium australafricanum]|uniref:Uncharacterized protein n=1 Tax=Mesorhizobium australafricanum TaxID=3072311 RepID=A0ABU4X4F8_9HYPH|nr:hypothetical protein [Mesorhizobium sp. VK3E]MDX8443220.1 hypothetical protein [Mesorhizobium sp. VK3E]